MELLGSNPSMQDLIEKLNEVVGSLNNSLPNTDSEIAEVKKLVSFGSGVLAGRLNAKLWYFKTQELMTASTELCEGDSCFVLKDGVTTGEGTFEYWYIYKTSDVADIVDSYVDLSNPDLVAVKLQDMTLKDVKNTLSAQISDQSKDLNAKISNLRTDTETALSGKADLVGGLIPASQLPSYVDDIIESWLEDIEFPENAYAKEDIEMTTPLTPEFSKIYVNLLNNKTYRWGGNFYVEVSKSLAIGETATTAFAGDRGVKIEESLKRSLIKDSCVIPVINGKVDIESLEELMNSGNYKVFFLSQDAVVESSIKITKDSTVFIGNSHSLVTNDDIPIFCVEPRESSLKHVTIQNFILKKPLGEKYICDFYDVFDCRVSFCDFTVTGDFSSNQEGKGAVYFHSSGLLTGNDGCFVNWITNCKFSNAIVDFSCSDSYFLNNIVWNQNTNYGIQISSSQINIENNQIVSGLAAGMIRIGYNTSTSKYRLIRIINNYFDGNNGDSILCKYGVLAFNMCNSIIANNSFTYLENSIKLMNCDGNEITSNTFWDNNKLGTGIAEIIISNTIDYLSTRISSNSFEYTALRGQTNDFRKFYENTSLYNMTCYTDNDESNTTAYKDNIINPHSLLMGNRHAGSIELNYPCYGSTVLDFSSQSVVSKQVLNLPFKIKGAIITPVYNDESAGVILECYSKPISNDDYGMELVVRTSASFTGSITINYVIF